ncbi:hypothetical protein K7X08_034431 [Anisodus acutangulus]|uniref:Tr-type G domain-containing protein n=1 Tax=Anisodus acutangulus TaxID=402998 RepID=A0A9Q1LIK3_9SOLA|nr:hypothetical protein K7X08_034431 [Anisodus acutangulus]
MISGATQADAAILVIDASVGAFEAAVDATGGQTREHAQLIKSFSVDQIIIAVNKMDTVGYSKEQFDAIKKQLGTFLRAFHQSHGCRPGFEVLAYWMQHSLQPHQRDYSKPFLMPICDVVRAQSQGQVSICGKLERGALQTGNKVLVMPFREMATVRSLERDSQVCNTAKAGDSVTINLQGPHPGHAIPILVASQLEFLVHHAKENAIIEVVLQGMISIDEHSI